MFGRKRSPHTTAATNSPATALPDDALSLAADPSLATALAMMAMPTSNPNNARLTAADLDDPELLADLDDVLGISAAHPRPKPVAQPPPPLPPQQLAAAIAAKKNQALVLKKTDRHAAMQLSLIHI